MSDRVSWWSGLAFPPVDQWKGFLLATLGIVLGAAAFDFLAAEATLSTDVRALASLRDAVELVAGALVCGLVVWIGIRVVRRGEAPEPKESVLWSACLIVIFVTAAKMLS